jgi:hypothetical protein
MKFLMKNYVKKEEKLYFMMKKICGEPGCTNLIESTENIVGNI